MINKYQQGGTAQGGVLALIQQLPQEQLQQLMLAFAQWAQQKGVDIQQLQSNPEALEQALGLFMQEMQAQQALMAKHGAKLQYIKGLKHQCPEGEHLEYFAKGGVVGCGCVKNKQGGKAEPKKGNALEQYKENKKIQLKKKECGGKMKKHQIGGTLETLRQSLGLEKKNLTKYQVGGTMTPVQAFLVKQANTLTQQSPTLGGFQVNNGQFDVISALEGDKLQPQNGTYNKLIGIFKHMIPGFREAVDMKNKRLEAQRNYDALQKANYRVRVPLLEPDNTPQLPVRFEASNRKPSYQEGGEMADNTRVASGRPQTVLNRIPWNAGRGPAGEGPMYLLDANITSNPNILTGAPTFLPGRFISPKIARQFRRYNLGVTSNPYIRLQAFENTMARTGGDVVKANEVANSVANHELLAQFLRDRFTNNEEWLYRTLLGGALAGSSYAGVKMNSNK